MVNQAETVQEVNKALIRFAGTSLKLGGDKSPLLQFVGRLIGYDAVPSIYENGDTQVALDFDTVAPIRVREDTGPYIETTARLLIKFSEVQKSTFGFLINSFNKALGLTEEQSDMDLFVGQTFHMNTERYMWGKIKDSTVADQDGNTWGDIWIAVLHQQGTATPAPIIPQQGVVTPTPVATSPAPIAPPPPAVAPPVAPVPPVAASAVTTPPAPPVAQVALVPALEVAITSAEIVVPPTPEVAAVTNSPHDIALNLIRGKTQSEFLPLAIADPVIGKDQTFLNSVIDMSWINGLLTAGTITLGADQRYV